ncbi:ABC transporter ATP-binding protein [Foetidibacter luteolus]|uniref:ABC transporter ATP-binding protein n=1 Tax=Foetidibacter luteolus TaxID=2608880 RepID=UPI00129B0A9A|nr:ABC transporter ATP-binding protein [Foetidibacter luteolus]
MTGNVILEVNNLHKLYRLGAISSGTLKKDIARWWDMAVLKKEDPLQKIAGEEWQDLRKQNLLWALHDVSFTVREGEVLGIIGKNGAGKSTLLKILSRVTRPTKGTVKGRGRVASLLEVGTGFHEELTGRENIYLNGNILGMTSKQVDKKLDEIIDFSGVEQYIDTPVKRYSSGMYVRLAFSVAAHLEPDVLIVDEALSVGDSEFQKKSMNKIREVSSKQGGTILFVSHSMHAVQSFCSRVILLESGRIINDNTPEKVISQYLHSLQKKKRIQTYSNPDKAPGDNNIRIKKVYLQPETGHAAEQVTVETTVHVKFEFWNLQPQLDISVGMYLFTVSGECVFTTLSDPLKAENGLVEGACTIPGNFLNNDSYVISLVFLKDISDDIFYYEECLFFDVEDVQGEHKWYGNFSGYVRPKLPFTLSMKTSNGG